MARTMVALCVLAPGTLSAAEDFFDRVDEALTWTTPQGGVRARLSGQLDAEGYALPHPAPGLIETEHNWLFNPRLTLFLDLQAGPSLYGFVQARADRGFDPAAEPLEARIDEYALRWAAGNAGRLSVQIGKFATVVGNWTARHDAWTNPFVTAPLPYENLTGIWDNEPPHSVGQLLMWSHVRPGLKQGVVDAEKYLRLPIVWGPSYATGLALAGEFEKFRYAFEVKNTGLSSRPETWSAREAGWEHPTVSGRIRYAPEPRWEFGWSASTGTFLRPEAGGVLTSPRGRGDYREHVIAQDISYAWRHLQVWAEVYAARFEIPGIGNADTLAYYVEAKYKFTPQLFGAVRWNQQLFGDMNDAGTDVRWGLDTWRLDVSPAYRLTPHVQVKLQYSLQWGDPAGRFAHLGALQATLRF